MTYCRNQLQKWTLLAGLHDYKMCMNYCCFIGSKLQQLCCPSCTIFDNPLSWARHFSDFLDVYSSLTPMSSTFPQQALGPYVFVSCLLRFPLILVYSPNCELSDGNSFIMKFTLKCSPTLSIRSVFHVGVRTEIHVAPKYTTHDATHCSIIVTENKWLMELIRLPTADNS
jgi:hypothetical protein